MTSHQTASVQTHVNIDITAYDSGDTKVHNPWRYILSCIVIIIMLYILCIMRACLKIQTYTVIYVCGVHVSTGKYTEVWQRLMQL